MKNMLTRTALASSMLLLGVSVASAQTTVSGNLDLVYKAVSSDKAAGRSSRFFGKESQINIANKGKLNNGMDYAAGFSLEFDGSENNTDSLANRNASLAGQTNENVYIDLIRGNTTITLGADHLQNPDKTLSNLVGVMDLDDAVAGVTSTKTAGVATVFVAAANSAYQAYNIGVTQTVPGVGKLSVAYAPDRNSGNANSDTTNVNATNNNITNYDKGQSAYELGFIGDLGVKGLEVNAFYNKSDSATSSETSDLKGEMYGVKYNFGQVTVAAQRAKTTSLLNVEDESDSFGIAYAVNQNISAGISYGKTDRNTSAIDEKITQVSVGYNLGPVMAGLSYAKVDNIGLEQGTDGETLALKLSTKF
jgi:hypothetical protein